MKKKFIQKSDLGDILEEVAEKACDIAKDCETVITFRDLGGDMVMDIEVKSARASRGFETFATQTYDIIDDLCDDMDVLDDTITAAKAKIEEEKDSDND